MAEQDPDVQAEPSPAEEQAQAQEAAAAQGAVSPVAAEETDQQGVPWKNRMAEFDRRTRAAVQEALATQAQQFQQQMAAYFQQHQPRPAAAEQKPQYTNEELASLASQGNSYALEMLTERKVQERMQAAQQVQTRVSVSQQQVRSVIARYPDAANPGTPLGQYVAQTYQGYIAAGHPGTPDTVLLAMTTAIADRPDLAGGQTQRGGDPSRAGAVQQHGAIAETSHRQQPAPRRGSTYEPTAAELRLAKQMGVKDPKAARERLIKRQASGQSSVSPIISQAVGDF